MDLRPRAQWDQTRVDEHATLLFACGFAGASLRRCSGIDPEPAVVNFKKRREWPLTADVPLGYLVVYRDLGVVGIFRALGPNDWSKDCPTSTMAARCCRAQQGGSRPTRDHAAGADSGSVRSRS
jgi:hypothetical protein